MHAIPLNLIIPLEEYTDEIKSQYKGRPLDLSYLKMLMLTEAQDLPPISVLRVPAGYVLLDGNHRVERARMKGEKEINAEFVENALPVPELIKRAYLANQKHGLPDKLSRRVDFALWLVAAEHMSIRDAASLAQVAPSSITRRKQKIKEQEIEEKPVEDERLKPLKRLFKAIDGLKDYDDTNMFEDLRMCLGGVTEGVEDLHEAICDLVGAFITCTGESPWHS
jgi:hypothetical protein